MEFSQQSTEKGQIYQISNYRVPKPHCTINDGVKAPLDQLRFKVEENDHSVTVSLHKEYLKLLPNSIFHDDVNYKKDDKNT